jgi:nucleotide-binding universal stress UspA family protein
MIIRQILIPTDGSDYSKTALEYGIYIGRLLEAELTGLHIIDVKILQGPIFSDIFGSVSLSPFPEFLTAIEKGLDERADAILEAFRRRCEREGLTPRIRKVTGIIDEEILRAGSEADLILLAQRGEHYPLSRSVLLGSTAEAVVRKSGKPVLVTPAKFREIESMGLAYDGSPPAHHALGIAAQLSVKTKWPITVILITDQASLAAGLTQKVESYLEPFEIDSDVIVLHGREEKEIIKFIQEGAVELMLMGAYGHTRFKELLLGSTTSHVIRNSTIPVLLTR